MDLRLKEVLWKHREKSQPSAPFIWMSGSFEMVFYSRETPSAE